MGTLDSHKVQYLVSGLTDYRQIKNMLLCAGPLLLIKVNECNYK